MMLGEEVRNKNSRAFKDQATAANPLIGRQMSANLYARHELCSSLAKFISAIQPHQKPVGAKPQEGSERDGDDGLFTKNEIALQ
jgi:hypothetical protein